MLELGDLAKRITLRPDWLDVPKVFGVYAVADCVSNDFCDDIGFWKHNGSWFFDSPALIRVIAVENDIDLSGPVLVYYWGHDQRFDADMKMWRDDGADRGFRPKERGTAGGCREVPRRDRLR
ncbi:MAG: hypothetical protein AB7U20_10895 [Planctomycetaceae bacterium]